MNRPGSAAPGAGSPPASNSPASNIILSSRASISRNLSNYKFPSSSTDEEKNQVISLVKNSTRRIKGLEDLCFLRLNRMNSIQRQVLLGDYQIDEDFLSSLEGRALMVLPRSSIRDMATAIPLCWKDHLKIQCSAPGNNINMVYEKVSGMEKLFEKKLNFSFSSQWGYLTSDPASLGTALEISLLVHLPALAISPDIAEFMKNLSQVGCAIGGYSAKSSEITGNIFRISSSRTLGKSEEEIVEEMNAICLNIVDEEKSARRKLLKKDRLGARDNVFRSFGLIKYAKILSFEEALELLSILRLGLDLGVIKKISDFDYFELINMVGDAHVISNFEMGDKATEDEIDLKRASLIRDIIMED